MHHMHCAYMDEMHEGNSCTLKHIIENIIRFSNSSVCMCMCVCIYAYMYVWVQACFRANHRYIQWNNLWYFDILVYIYIISRLPNETRRMLKVSV